MEKEIRSEKIKNDINNILGRFFLNLIQKKLENKYVMNYQII